jgi:aspartyl-tRNA(Asn)/glutamyl-tRNA(Gln) amidotransferase subunit C
MTDGANKLRQDELGQPTPQEEALKNAPSKDSYYFKVPKVISNPGN